MECLLIELTANFHPSSMESYSMLGEITRCLQCGDAQANGLRLVALPQARFSRGNRSWDGAGCDGWRVRERESTTCAVLY
ncbi:MAG: hypothetical protein D6723_13000 [Acidobacteria bacterium]|nr:MAG: hypothetical protein D6723_13000 [Acidobacteriota bacterium]